MLTDEDIKRIGAEFTKRMIDNRIFENRRRNKQKSVHTTTARFDFQDGNPATVTHLTLLLTRSSVSSSTITTKQRRAQMLDDKDINHIAQKVAQILSNEQPTEQPTKQTHAYQAELGRHGFVDGLGNHYNLLDFLRGPAVIDMTDDGCGCFFLVFNNGRPSHWVGDSGVEKDMEEMIEFITDELTGEFKITRF